MRLRKYIQDIASAGVPTVLVKLRGLILLPFLVHAVGLEGYGAWIQVIASTNLLMLLASLGLHSALIRFYPEESDQAGVSQLISTTLLLTFASAMALALAYTVLALPISRALLHTHEWRTLFRIGALLIPLGVVRLILVSHFRAQDRIRWISAAESAYGLGELVLVAGAAVLARSVYAVVFATVLSLSAYVVLLLATLWKEGFRPRVASRHLGEHLRYSIPLIPTLVADEVINRGDRLIVGIFLGAEAVGLYSATYALASAPMMLGTPVVTALLPKVVDSWCRGDRRTAGAYVGITAQGITVAFLGLFVASALVGDQVLALLVGSTGAFLPTGLLISAGTSAYALGRVYSTLLYADKATHRLSVIWLGSGAANIVLNLLLVPRLGLIGAGTSTALTYFFFLLTLITLTWQEAKYPFKWRELFRMSLRVVRRPS